MNTGSGEPEICTLSIEEELIIGFLYDGLTQKAIGRKLGTTDRTVRRRLDELKFKFEADSSIQIPVKASESGVWSPPE